MLPYSYLACLIYIYIYIYIYISNSGLSQQLTLPQTSILSLAHLLKGITRPPRSVANVVAVQGCNAAIKEAHLRKGNEVFAEISVSDIVKPSL
jgi:hypothetical protein